MAVDVIHDGFRRFFLAGHSQNELDVYKSVNCRRAYYTSTTIRPGYGNATRESEVATSRA
jgi:hypothetical protein